MHSNPFLKIILVLSLFTFGLILISNSIFPKLGAHAYFSFATEAMFIIFCVLAYFAGKRAVKSANKYRFIQLLVIIIMGKIVLSLAMVLTYIKIVSPNDNLFVIPFFLIYLIYTAFEVYFLEKIAKGDEKHDIQGDH